MALPKKIRHELGLHGDAFTASADKKPIKAKARQQVSSFIAAERHGELVQLSAKYHVSQRRILEIAIRSFNKMTDAQQIKALMLDQ